MCVYNGVYCVSSLDPSSLIVAEVGDVTSHTSQQRKRKKGSRSDKDVPQLIGVAGKDTTLFLFRALGKILYAKRELRCTAQLSMGLSYFTQVAMNQAVPLFLLILLIVTELLYLLTPRCVFDTCKFYV